MKTKICQIHKTEKRVSMNPIGVICQKCFDEYLEKKWERETEAENLSELQAEHEWSNE